MRKIDSCKLAEVFDGFCVIPLRCLYRITKNWGNDPFLVDYNFSAKSIITAFPGFFTDNVYPLVSRAIGVVFAVGLILGWRSYTEIAPTVIQSFIGVLMVDMNLRICDTKDKPVHLDKGTNVPIVFGSHGVEHFGSVAANLLQRAPFPLVEPLEISIIDGSEQTTRQLDEFRHVFIIPTTHAVRKHVLDGLFRVTIGTGVVNASLQSL